MTYEKKLDKKSCPNLKFKIRLENIESIFSKRIIIMIFEKRKVMLTSEDKNVKQKGYVALGVPEHLADSANFCQVHKVNVTLPSGNVMPSRTFAKSKISPSANDP